MAELAGESFLGHGYRPSRPESKPSPARLNIYPFKAGGSQSVRQLLRVDRHECIGEVIKPHPHRPTAVRPHENSSRPQNPTRLREQPVLKAG